MDYVRGQPGMRVKKALIGWWVYPNEIWSTKSPATFKVIKPSANT